MNRLRNNIINMYNIYTLYKFHEKNYLKFISFTIEYLKVENSFYTYVPWKIYIHDLKF